MKGRLYNSLTSLVLVLTFLARLIISLTCQQLIAVSKNSAILGSWNTSVMNQTFSFILLFLFVPITAFPFCLYPAAFISSTKSCAPAAQHSWASAHGRLSSCPAILWLHPSPLEDRCHLADSREELLQSHGMQLWGSTSRQHSTASRVLLISNVILLLLLLLPIFQHLECAVLFASLKGAAKKTNNCRLLQSHTTGFMWTWFGH